MDAELLRVSQQYWEETGLRPDSEDEIIAVGDLVLYTPHFIETSLRSVCAKFNATSSPNHVMFWNDFNILSSTSNQQKQNLVQALKKAQQWANNPSGFLLIDPHKDSAERYRLGKSAIAKAIHTSLLNSGITSVFWSVPSLIQAWYTNGGSLTQLQRRGITEFSDSVKEAIIQISSTTTVLILDDYSAFYKTEYASSFLDTLLIGRSDDDTKGTVITTSDKLDSIRDNFPLLYSRVLTGVEISLRTEQYPIALASGNIVVGKAL